MAHSVLVVDDRPEVVELLSSFLEADHRLRLDGVARDGTEAVAHSERGCPDAIILDVEMPRMSGLEALPILRRACPTGVIVIYSSDPVGARTAPRLGADAVVDKADDPLDLIDLVADLCRTRSDDALSGWAGP
ncbi:MAG TPA: response regulator [Nocardioides sp.]|nr:response regulator [Nocardioides sp.]